MLGAIKYNLGHLLDFSGRDARQTFWFYVLFLFLANMALGVVAGFVMIGSLVNPVIAAAQSGASEEAMRAQVAAQMGEFMGTLLRYSAAGNVLTTLLLAAAFVRRLHDSNRSGWCGRLRAASISCMATAGWLTRSSIVKPLRTYDDRARRRSRRRSVRC